MEKAPDEYCLDLDPAKFELIADLASVLYLNVSNLDTALFLQAASLQKGKCVTAQVPGMVHVESGSGFRFGSQIYVKVLVDAESSTYYSSVNASFRPGRLRGDPDLGDSVLRWRS